MNTFLKHESTPEKLMWCTVIHQAVRDLGYPNSNTYSRQTLRPLENDIFRSAMQLIFSGKEDDHKAWEYSGLSPKAIRADVINKMKEGVTVGQVGSRETPMGPIDYRQVRKLVLRAFDQVDHFYCNREEDVFKELLAEDCRLDFLSLLGHRKGWGVEV